METRARGRGRAAARRRPGAPGGDEGTAPDDARRFLDEELAARVPGPDDCIACRACESHCPQGIAIPDCLSDARVQLAAR